jgi:TonB family protein
MINERQRNTIAAASTVIILGLLWILLLLFSLSRPYPPPPEYGVEVMGAGSEGAGRAQSAVSQQPTSPSQESPSEENTVTENNENVAIPKPTTPRPTTARPVATTPTQPQQTTQPEEPQLNPMASFPGRRTTQGSGEGTGNSDGSGAGTGTGSGTGSGTGTGAGAGNFGDGSWKLDGRQANSLPKPAYNSDDQGIVVVRITVNRDGVVIKAEPGAQGTTTSSQILQQTAKEAALKSRFSANKDAPEQQVGTITYRFIKVN